MRWTLEDHTDRKAGFLRILCDGERAADVFPYAKDADPDKVTERARYMVETLNGFKPDADLQQCEHCDKEFPIETMTSMEDCWFCAECFAAWQKEFEACDHRWKPHTSTMSEPGRICERCNGFVADADAASLQLSS